MRPRNHLIAGILATVFLALLGVKPVYYITFFLASIFIDLDHATRYSLKTKNFSVKKFLKHTDEEYKFFNTISLAEKKKYRYPFYVFHGIEALVAFFIIGFYIPIAHWIFAGFLFHMIGDYIEISQKKYPFLFKFSQIIILFRNKNKKSP